MTYNVFGGTLNPTQIVYGTTTTSSLHECPRQFDDTTSRLQNVYIGHVSWYHTQQERQAT